MTWGHQQQTLDISRITITLHSPRADDACIVHTIINLAPFWKTFLKLIGNGQKSTSQQYRRLFPSTRSQIRAGIGSFRNTFSPSLRQRAQSSIYRYLVARQSRKQHKKQINNRNQYPAAVGSTRRNRVRGQPNNEIGSATHNMAYLGQGGGESGSKRKMLKGYLKAANDMRESYVQSYWRAEGSGGDHLGEQEDGPGAFPDAAVVRSGNEEMILFPSYARKHVHSASHRTASPGREMTEEELWKREWDKHEDINAVVDVDVRGWIYTPHQGPSTRKQRLVIGLARQLSGIPAPPTTRPSESATSSRASSPSGSFRVSQQEQDLIQLEADKLERKGLDEERFAERGAYSEKPSRAADTDSIYGDRSSERGRQRASYASTPSSQSSDSGTMTPIQHRPSWKDEGSRMSAAELHTANKHLLNRLRPFMANPLARTPISAFFYNSDVSRQLTVYTDASGHFTVCAALDFIPTHVRVLAGEKLSATEEVVVTNPRGVSLISDIDDTIKHSAISDGAREIFRNAFTRELGDLMIDGVREWYETLHHMGVKLHYVSNAPWQMYPVLTTYFKLAQLPRGSFHLKQYSGMLQGIFEPVAERKKSSLDKIFRDFPERKFVLVGDSGEADLEVYTETAVENPGRVLGIFIRDVTTKKKTGYFDSNNGPDGGSKRHSRDSSRSSNREALTKSKRLSRPTDLGNDDPAMKAALAASMVTMEEDARRARRSINPDAPSADSPRGSRTSSNPSIHRTNSMAAPPEEDLIDFSEPTPPQPEHDASSSKPSPGQKGVTSSHNSAASPPPPPKPAGLRSPPPDGANKVPPPIPRKPSSTVQQSIPQPSQAQSHRPSPLSQVTRQDSARKPAPPLPARPKTYLEMAKDTLAKARPDSAWPSEAPSGQSRPRTGNASQNSPRSRPMSSFGSVEDLRLSETSLRRTAPAPPPARRTMTSTSAKPSTQRFSGSGWDENDQMVASPGEVMSKKEYLWKQRWDRAKSLLERNGVTMRTWVTGEDVAATCVRLVEMEMRKIEKETGNSRS